MGVFFSQPLFLLGLTAALLPVIIHLIHRPKKRRMRFSTLRFLIASDNRSARRHRLVDWLALLLRMLLLALLALALSQPLLRPRSADGIGFGPLAAAIVIDDSMSMQRTADGIPLFDKAVSAAKEILDSMPPDAEAGIFLSSGRTQRDFTTPGMPSLLVSALNDVRCSYSGRPIVHAINSAAEFLAKNKRKNRVMVVISDCAKHTFAGKGVNMELLEKSKSTLELLQISQKESLNCSILKSTVSPKVALPGTKVRVTAEVVTNSEDTVEARTSLWSGAGKLSEKKINVSSKKPASVAFDYEIEKDADSLLSLRLERDSLVADNIQHIALQVMPRIKIGVLSTSGSAVNGEGHYLLTALSPTHTSGTSNGNSADVTSLSFADASDSEALSGFKCVFLIGADAPGSTIDALSQFVRAGNCVVVFPSAGMTAGKSPVFDHLGLQILEIHKRGAGQEIPGIGEISRGNPIISFFQTVSPKLLNELSFSKFLRVDESHLDSKTQVIMRLANGAPFLLERRRETGAWLVFTSAVDLTWSNLPVQPMFLPMICEILKYCSGQAIASKVKADIDTGISLAIPSEIASSANAAVTDPSGVTTHVPLTADQGQLDLTNVALPGIYQIAFSEEPAKTFNIALNTSPTESDFAVMDSSRYSKIFSSALSVNLQRSSKTLSTKMQHFASGIALAPYLLWLALVILLMESYLVNAMFKERIEGLHGFNRIKAWMTK